MKELVAKIQIYNNRLRERRQQLGLSAKALAERAGLNYQRYLALEALRVDPYPRRFNTRIWSKSARKLAEFYKTDEEELFPEAALAVERRQVEYQFNAEEVFALLGLGSERHLLPDDVAERKEVEAAIASALGALTPREETVIRRRFGFDGRPMTIEEVAAEFELTRSRIGQIEKKALRKLRRPWLSRPLIAAAKGRLP